MNRSKSPAMFDMVRGTKRLPRRRSRLACGKARVHFETRIISDPMASDTSPRPEQRVLNSIS